MMRSAVLIIPASMREAANGLAVAMGWGDENYTIPLSSDGETITHYAARADVGDEFIAMARGEAELPAAVAEIARSVIAQLNLHFSPDPDNGESLPLWGREHLEAAAAAVGLAVREIA